MSTPGDSNGTGITDPLTGRPPEAPAGNPPIRVAIVDDVVSSGGTLHSLRQIIEEVGGEVAAVVAVFTEGQERPEVTALGHLPLFQ